MKVIKLLDREKAEFLRAQGYSYQEEEISGRKVFSFLERPGLMDLLLSRYEKSDFFVRDFLNFCGKEEKWKDD